MVKNKRTLLMIAATLVILGLAAVAHVILSDEWPSRDKEVSASCTEANDNQHVASFQVLSVSTEDTDVSTQLTPLVQSIENESGYEQNINCMYILTYYYAGTYDAAQAKDSLAKLKSLQAEGQQISEGFSFGTVEFLEEKIAFIEVKINETFSNSLEVSGTQSE